MKKFVILAAPRTGSNLLCTLLNSHPRVLCHHEVFNPNGIFYALNQRDGSIDLGSVADRDGDPLQFLERLWQTGRGHDCVGFKWTRGQNQTVHNDVLNDRAIGKIIVRRNNRIKVYVSEQIAMQTGQWEAYSERDLADKRPRIHVDLAELKKQVLVNEEFYAQLELALAQSQQTWLDVRYEDMFSIDRQTRLLEFLDVDQAYLPLQATSVKQNASDLSELVKNFAEFAAAVAGTDFEPELYERRF